MARRRRAKGVAEDVLRGLGGREEDHAVVEELDAVGVPRAGPVVGSAPGRVGVGGVGVGFGVGELLGVGVGVGFGLAPTIGMITCESQGALPVTPGQADCES